MSIACLRRPPRAADRSHRRRAGVLAASLPDCRIGDARLAAENDGVRYWLVPISDGEAVWFVGLGAEGGGVLDPPPHRPGADPLDPVGHEHRVPPPAPVDRGRHRPPVAARCAKRRRRPR